MKIKRLNHAVLFVQDLDGMQRFYESTMKFVVAERIGSEAVFLRAAASDNHHDLGLIKTTEPRPVGTANLPGLYHLAWQVDDVGDLVDARKALVDAGCLVGESEHGTSLSLYAKDPEGNELEVFWLVPSNRWHERSFGIRPLDLESEVAFWSS